jgi:hypothetical protein
MAKRELVLIAGFAAAGVLAWQLTAPAGKPGGEGFSLTAFRSGLRNLRGAQIPAQVRKSASLIPVHAVTRVQLPDIVGQVIIRGGTPGDLSAELDGTVYVVDEAEKTAVADRVRFSLEQEGSLVRVVLTTPTTRRTRPRFTLTLSVPSHVEASVVVSGERLDVRDIAAIRAEVRRAQTRITGISGKVELEQREGGAELEQIGSLIIESRRANIDVQHVSGTLRGEVFDGRLLVRNAGGDLELESRRAGIDIDDAAAGVRLTAQDGRASMRRVKGPIRYEGRRCGLTLEAVDPVALDASSTEERLDLTLAGRNMTLDIAAEQGSLEVPEEGFPAVQHDGERRVVTGEVGNGGPLVRIRAHRSHVVLRR